MDVENWENDLSSVKCDDSIYKYWGKAKKDSSTNGPDYHLLVYHCLDVAAVGFSLLKPELSSSQFLAKKLGVDAEWLQCWFRFCLMLHDLGKFFRAFQNLAPNLSPKLVPADKRCLYKKRHDTLGYAHWCEIARKNSPEITAETQKLFDPWMQIVFGHHGKPQRCIKKLN